MGTGHVMRCMAQAEEMERRGFEPVFASAPGTAETVPSLSAKKWRRIEVSVQDEGKQAELIQRELGGPAAALVIDHYGLGETFEKAARGFADLVAVFDDHWDHPHDCDVLVIPNIGFMKRNGAWSVPDHCRVMMGPAFAPMRAEFHEMREAALAARKLERADKRVLVSFGGSDPANGSGLALAALELISPRPKIDVAIGSAAPALEDLQARYGKIAAFHIGTNKMARLMADADIAIGAGGSTATERAALGLPSILVSIADNQLRVAQASHELGMAIDLGPIQSVNVEMVKGAVQSLLRDPARRQNMSAIAAEGADGRGAERIAFALAGNDLTSDNSIVLLHRVDPHHQDMILQWQREPGARRHSRNPEPPTEEEHARWFSQALNDPNRMFALIETTCEACGFVRLDRKPDGSCEVNLLVSHHYHGRGIGPAALRLARKCLPRAVLNAYIHPENTASVAAFTKAGYIRVADDLMRSVPA